MAGEQSGGEGITYNDIDANKMVNKAGLLELSGKIKGYIQANAGGGASYTAGDGIDITNDVISSTLDKKIQTPWGVLLDGNLTATFNIQTLSTDTSKDTVLSYLKKGIGISFPSFVFGNDWWGQQITLDELRALGYQYYYVVNNNNYKNPTRTGMSGSNKIYTSFGGTGNIMPLGETLICGSRTNIAKCLVSFIKYDNSSSGLTATKLNAAIDELAARPVVSIPIDPSADGAYILTSTVSSGTATRTWESVVIGGSY